MIKKIYYIAFIILLYLYLFNPPFSIFRGILGVGNIIVLCSFIFALIKPKVIKKYINCFKNERSLLIFLFAYVFLRTIIGGESTILTQHFLALCNLLLVIPMILYIANRIGLTEEQQIVRAFLIVGTLASLISIYCLITPSVQEYMKSAIYQYSEDDYLMLNDYRGFGFASNLGSNYGYVLGIIAGVGSLFLRNNKIFIVSIPLLLFATLINARTGALLTILIVLFSILSQKKFSYAIAMGILALILVRCSSYFFDMIGIDERTLQFSMGLFKESGAALQGNTEDSFTATELLTNHIVFPPTIVEWIVGRGCSIVKGGAEHSDMGWILQLNYGGLIYVSILYTFFLVMVNRLWKKREKTFMWILIISILILNTKTSIFPGYTSFYLLFILYALKILPDYQMSEKRMTTK